MPNSTLIHGDCLTEMQKLPNGSVDLTVTSPPYDNLRTYNGYTFDFEGIAKELHRITKDGGVVVWVVGDATVKGSETGTSFKQALYFKEIGFNLHDTMIYLKHSPAFPDKVRYGQVFEYMFIFSKGIPKTRNLLTDRKNKWAGQTSFGESSFRLKDGTLQKKGKIKVKDFGIRFNVWSISNGAGFSSKDKIAFQHPAIFPEKLAEDHILSWSNRGDTVLDPMCGSGTTLKMAKKNGRNYIGIEISKEYCDIATARINAVQEPML